MKAKKKNGQRLEKWLDSYLFASMNEVICKISIMRKRQQRWQQKESPFRRSRQYRVVRVSEDSKTGVQEEKQEVDKVRL